MDIAGGDMAQMVAPPSEDSPGPGVPLVEQVPFIERIISDFAANADFLAAYLVGRSGDSFVASSGAAAPAILAQRDPVALGKAVPIGLTMGILRGDRQSVV